ncbi:glycosyltransferase [Novosphingobium sp. FKTRR1]|uniref:glycosyltransferase n=1 Tax=Novosphingobium sp. FKTRR1 TaxID=2879118 RepID=UPI001CF0B3BE|nr:glycosyltransferase [Novosphingobium sp. FKTRR1]
MRFILAHRTATRLRNRALFGPLPFARLMVCAILHRQIAAMKGVFDAGFYLDQIHYPVQRRMAARAPELHYLLVGARLGRLPGPLFDLPRARETHPGVPARHLLRTALSSGAPPLLRTAALPADDPRPGVLLLDHARGGGSSQFLDLLADRLEAEGERVIRTLRLDQPEPRFAVRSGDQAEIIGLGPEAEPLLAALLARLGITRMVVNHVIDLPLDVVANLPALTRRLGITYEVILHDYLAACPRVNLVDVSGRYCALPDLASCQTCVAPLGIAMAEWRAASAALLHGAQRVTVPSRDLAIRMARVFGDIPLDVWNPEREPAASGNQTIQPADAPLSIVVIGALNRPKGFDVLLALADEARRTNAPVQFTLLGYSSDDAALRRAGVTVTGRYRNADARSLLRDLAPHLVLFPAIWPETWSFTLTHALATGNAIAAFDLGAIADRLRGNHSAHLLAPELANVPERLLQRLVTLAQGRRNALARTQAIMPPNLAATRTDWSDPANPEGCVAEALSASRTQPPRLT